MFLTKSSMNDLLSDYSDNLSKINKYALDVKSDKMSQILKYLELSANLLDELNFDAEAKVLTKALEEFTAGKKDVTESHSMADELKEAEFEPEEELTITE